MQTETGSHPGSKRRHHTTLMVILSLLLVLAIAGGAWLFLKYREAVETNPKTIEQRTVQQVADMVEVPDENPSVVTVTDASKLSNQELASRSKNDDKLLIYAGNKRIIIFRPSNGKIVDMLTIRDAATTPEPEAVTTETGQ